MEFFEVVKKRYSVRSYRRDPVEDHKLQQVLEAVRLAPTADNRQPFEFIVIHTAGKEAELRRIYDRAWFVQAPVIICGCAIPARAWVRQDSKDYLGLGTCWIAAFNPDLTREVLGLPDSVETIAFTPLGYADDQHGAKKRKPLTDIVRYEHWQE